MSKKKWSLIAIILLALILGYSYIKVSTGPIDPMGRLAFVKLANPDMYPGHPHSELLSKEAENKGSQTAMVLQMYGGSNYRSYQEGNVYIIEVAFIDTQGMGSINLSQVNFFDSLKVAIFGVPVGRYKYMSDGTVYNNYDEMMSHVNSLAREHGQKGPIPMVFKGTVREGNPIITPGEGFPLYFQILTKTYGLIPAYVYTLSGLISPYLNNPYRNFELIHASDLQYYYNHGQLNLDYKKVNTNVSKYYTQLYQNNTASYGG
ncbi:hypothetical protein [Methanobacterium spitsbergense]|uniref:Uncharacterized protein n=1 Tax=Methanobacterium spitsbergense TaxID=2874285 RepID=A0A8T5URY2_9EURY|nr:hypothetical protein [Methanobacterium spitsbergense]MBZ2166444.1 hypothetical protein [Methanobacterium spitsbergense]